VGLTGFITDQSGISISSVNQSQDTHNYKLRLSSENNRMKNMNIINESTFDSTISTVQC